MKKNVMSPDIAKQILLSAQAQPDEESCSEAVTLPPAVLASLTPADIPLGVAFEVADVDEKGVHHIKWDGKISRDAAGLIAEHRIINTRKYWYSPVGLEHYTDLIRRAVETRARTKNDVSS